MKKIFLFALGVIAILAVKAQDSIRITGAIQLHAGSSVAGFGNLSNASTAQFVNQGSLYLSRNLNNDEISMSPGSGTLYLNGSSQQVIGGSQTFKTYNLNSDNTAGVLLNANLSVTGTHTFSNGMILTSATPNYLVYESGAGYTGDNDARHVNGWVMKNGSEDFSFPVGDGTYERKAALTSLSAISSFNCHYYTPTSNIFNLASPLVQVKANEYWQINKLSGGTARITLNWDHSRVAMDHVLVSEILAGYYTSGQWTSAGGSASGNVLTTGSVTSNVVSNFGMHTLGYTNFPLPLKLISFYGVRNNGVSVLNWITENESQLALYSVERSLNGITYNEAGQLPAGNTGARSTYRYNDTIHYTGIAYYRLKITETDGKISYSKVISLNESGAATDIFTAVNPVYSAINLIGKVTSTGEYRYRLSDLSGKQIQQGTVVLTNGGMVSIPLNRFVTAGLYQLELSNNQQHQTAKIIIR